MKQSDQVLLISSLVDQSGDLTHFINSAGFEVLPSAWTNERDLLSAITESTPHLVLVDTRAMMQTRKISEQILNAVHSQNELIPLVFILSEDDSLGIDLLNKGACDYVLDANLIKLPLIIERECHRHASLEKLSISETKEHKLRKIVEQSTNLFYLHNEDHVLTYVSPQSHYFLGCSPEEAKRRWTDFVTDHPVNKKGYKFSDRALKTGEKQPPFELQLRRLDGVIIWVQVNEVPIQNEDGSREIMGSLTDITKLKLAQERDQTLSRVASETHNMVIITDAEQRIEWVNTAYENITGYTLKEVRGKNPGDLLQGPKTDPKTVQRIAEKLQQGEPFDDVILNYTKSGDPYWVKLNITPIFDEQGYLIKYFSIQEDITKQRAFEEKLSIERERLIESQRVGNMGDWSYDLETEEILWSRNMFQIYELPESETPPDLSKILDMYPDHKEQHLEAIKQAIEHGNPYSFDVKLVTEKGTIKYLHIEGRADLNEQQKVTHLHGTVLDITQRKKAEIELEKRERELASFVNNLDGMFYRYVLKKDGTDLLEYVSDGVIKIHEITPEEAYENTSSMWSQVLEEDHEALIESVKVSADNLSQWDHKWRVQTASGKIKWLHGRGSPFKDKDGNTVWDSMVMDITEQETHKREKNDLYAIIEKSIAEVYIMDTESLEVIYANKIASQNLGYTQEELIGMTPNEINAEFNNQRQKFKSVSSKILSGELPSSVFETKHRRKNGSTYYAQVQISLSNYMGKPVYALFTQDITEQKTADLRMKSLLDLTPIAIFMHTSDGTVIDLWNQAAETYIGYSKSDIMGEKIPYVNHPDMQEYSNMLETLNSGKPVIGKELTLFHKNGRTFPARLNAISIPDDQYEKDVILVTLEDISDERELRNDLKYQLALISSILDSMPGLFYILDEDLNFQRVNKNSLTFFDLDESALPHLNIYEFIYEEDHSKIQSNIERILKEGFAEDEIRVKRKDRLHHFYLNGKLMEMDGKKYIVGNGIDITERVLAQKHNRILIQEVHHRVKNNLAIISGLLWLEMSDAKNTRAALPLQRSINRIHSMAKVHELLYKTQDLSSIRIEDYLRELTEVIKNTLLVEGDIQIKIRTDNFEMNVNEAVPLGMLLNELISNSIKYAFPNNTGVITISLSKKGSVYHVQYHDNGEGIEGKFELTDAKTLGVKIIYTLLKQLQAEFELNTNDQFKLEFSFSEILRGSVSNI